MICSTALCDREAEWALRGQDAQKWRLLCGPCCDAYYEGDSCGLADTLEIGEFLAQKRSPAEVRADEEADHADMMNKETKMEARCPEDHRLVHRKGHGETCQATEGMDLPQGAAVLSAAVPPGE